MLSRALEHIDAPYDQRCHVSFGSTVCVPGCPMIVAIHPLVFPMHGHDLHHVQSPLRKEWKKKDDR